MALAAHAHHRTAGTQRQPAVLLGVVVLFASAMILRLGWLQLLQGQLRKVKRCLSR